MHFATVFHREPLGRVLLVLPASTVDGEREGQSLGFCVPRVSVRPKQPRAA